MALRAILQHTAVPVRLEISGELVEGERDEDTVEGSPFACVLFPEGTREAGRSGRRIEQPQMLVTGLDKLGDPIDLHAEDQVRVTDAPGLDPKMLGLYQVDGEPLAFGRPGRAPKGYQILLKRVQGGS